MEGALERVLRLVAEGRLTAEEAGPILDALASTDRDRGRSGDAATTDETPGGSAGSTPRFARIEVRDAGKRVVDLRIPISLGRFALGRVPGLSTDHLTEIQQAVASGTRGPILDVEDADGDGLPSWREYLAGTDPFSVDTNGNGLSDLADVRRLSQSANPDDDGDGVPNIVELTLGTDPFRADTDGDGDVSEAEADAEGGDAEGHHEDRNDAEYHHEGRYFQQDVR